jgi:hypothetical protein
MLYSACSAPAPALHSRRAVQRLTLVGLLAALCACGGGGDDGSAPQGASNTASTASSQATTATGSVPLVNCQARPEICR